MDIPKANSYYITSYGLLVHIVEVSSFERPSYSPEENLVIHYNTYLRKKFYTRAACYGISAWATEATRLGMKQITKSQFDCSLELTTTTP